MKIIFLEDFEKTYKKIKDKATKERILKQLSKLESNPESGKPLMHNLKNHRSVRVHPFRIIYKIENNTIFVLCFDHRKEVYE